jgi:DNA (cytosine-5)-methyltransferase 1
MNVVSLFSGAGGLDLGFNWAGHNIVWANDLYKDAVDTYRKNLGDHIVLADIASIDSKDIPDADIVIGGFPCQGFSVANTKRHTGDKRNALYLQLLRVVKDKRPLFFLAENVKGLLNFNHGEVIRMIVKDFESVGYKVKYKLLNAADFGVPQQRERVIITGVRNDIDFEYEYPSPTYSKEGSLFLPHWRTVGEALRGIPDPDTPNDLSNHVYSKYKVEISNYIGHRYIDPNLPAPTVTGRGDEKGGVVVLHHPNNKRRMTCRELATIQSFPIDYTFSGSMSSVYRQIANAVPPMLGKAVASQFNQYCKHA